MGTSLRGVNLAGGEWAYDPAVTPVAGTHYLWVSHRDIDYLVGKGVGFGRLLFSWEILQPALNQPFDAAYAADMTDRVSYATGRGMRVMIEPHGGEAAKFARYKGDPVGSAAVPNAAFADLWARLAQLHKGNSKVVFGLTNEPNAISTVQWYAAAQAAIDAVRDAGATNLILVPGNGFSQPGTWGDSWYDTATPAVSNATGWSMLHDRLGNTAASVHTYFDADGGGGDPGSIVSPDVIGRRLQPVVDWARAGGHKVHLSEFGASAAAAGAAAAVANAVAYMDANADVVIGWAWWTYGPPLFWGTYPFTLCPTNDYGTDDPKMAWLTPHFDAPPALSIPDNPADSGAEPNTTTAVGWESPDVWVRQRDDGGDVGEQVRGGRPCYVSVRVHNRGLWPSPGDQVVRLLWAKASAGLSYPTPWDGSTVSAAGVVQGGPVGPARPVPPVAGGRSTTIVFPWTAPNPVDYLGDDHFCLLACLATVESPPFEGFSGGDLNASVLNRSTAAWRNVHILPAPTLRPGRFGLGNVVVSNATGRDMQARLAFELLDESGRPVGPSGGTLRLTPIGPTRAWLRAAPPAARGLLEEAGPGVYRVADAAGGVRLPGLRAGDIHSFSLEYVPDRPGRGYAVRAVQLSAEGATETVVGGQTFVVGDVEGVTVRRGRRGRRGDLLWPWVIASGSLLLLAALLGGRSAKKIE